MKILVLCDGWLPDTPNSVSLIAANIARQVKELGHDVRVITTVQRKEDAREYEYEGIPVHALYSNYQVRWQAYRSLYNPGVVSQIRKIIAEFKPDVVHAHNIHYHLSYHALKLAKESGARVILTAHDVMLFHYGKLKDLVDPDLKTIPKQLSYKVSPWQQFLLYRWRYNPLRNVIIKRYLRYCDHVCAVSNEHKRALEENGIHVTDVVYNGIDLSLWRMDMSAAQTFKRDHGLEGKRIILYSGRVESAKGVWQVVRALPSIRERVPNAVFVVAGMRDKHADALMNDAKALGLETRVFVTGWLEGEELHASYMAADVVMLPSLCFETFGMVVVEGMAMGKPVVATCFGGPAEVVENGVTGIVVNPFNVSMLADAISDLLFDSAKSKRFGEAGRERVSHFFTLEKQIAAYILLYTERTFKN